MDTEALETLEKALKDEKFRKDLEQAADDLKKGKGGELEPIESPRK